MVVVLVLPVADDDLRVQQRVEAVDVEALVAEANSTGRRNTLIVEVFSSGDKGLAREDERGS